MALEIVEERLPIPVQSVFVEIVKRKRERVVYSHERRNVRAEFADQPFGERASRPVFARTGRWGDLRWRSIVFGDEDANARQARKRRFGAGVINADVPRKHGRS